MRKDNDLLKAIKFRGNKSFSTYLIEFMVMLILVYLWMFLVTL